MKFEDFQVIQTLAETHGGKTVVYLCRYEGKLEVCKAIQKQSVINDGKAIEHLKNEKQALQHFTELGNNNVCKLLGTFQDEKNAYLRLQMVEGLPIHKLIQMTGKFTERFVRIILVQVAQIMRQFHEQGFIYRDIKSSNFMIDQRGRVKMVDLGKSKRIRKERTFTICGTTHAMPPDVYQKKGYSYQFDYYSFGVLVYELLVGTSPFGYATQNQNILQDIKNGLTLEAVDKIENEDAKQLIVSLMKMNPAERFGSSSGFEEIIAHKFLQQEKQFGMEILQKKEKLSQYEKDFSEFVSEIQDFGLDEERYQQITEDDPFFKFLQK